jgi:hypothetical protein
MSGKSRSSIRTIILVCERLERSRKEEEGGERRRRGKGAREILESLEKPERLAKRRREPREIMESIEREQGEERKERSVGGDPAEELAWREGPKNYFRRKTFFATFLSNFFFFRCR